MRGEIAFHRLEIAISRLVVFGHFTNPTQILLIIGNWNALSNDEYRNNNSLLWRNMRYSINSARWEVSTSILVSINLTFLNWSQSKGFIHTAHSWHISLASRTQLLFLYIFFLFLSLHIPTLFLSFLCFIITTYVLFVGLRPCLPYGTAFASSKFKICLHTMWEAKV